MKFVITLLLAFSVCTVAACSKPKAKLVPVTGILTISGEPAADIMVQFVPNTIDETVVAPTSQALTDSSGNFDLFTLQNERGAIEGSHIVSLFDTKEERPAQGEQATNTSRLDSKYASGGITVDVVEGKQIILEATGPR